MPGLVVTVTGKNGIGPALNDVERSAAAFQRRMQRNISVGLGQWMGTGSAPNPLKVGLDAAAHSGFNLNGIMRESLVIVREIGRGNWARVPGSISLLAQYAGVLKYILSPIGAMVIAIGAGAYVAAKAFKNWSEEAKNLHRLLTSSNLTLNEEGETMKRVAVETQKFTDWVNSLGEAHVSLAEKVDRAISRLREEHELQMEIAKDKGASSLQIEKMKEDQLQKELNLIERAKEAAYAKRAIDESAAKKTARDLNNKELESSITSAAKKSGDFGEIAQIIQDKMMGGVYGDLMDRKKAKGGGAMFSSFFDTATGKTVNVSLDEQIKHLEGELVEVTVKGQKYSMSLEFAKKKLDESAQEEARLKSIQQELRDILEKKKKLTEEDVKDIQKLAHEESSLISKINNAAQYGQQAAMGSKGHGGGGGRSVTERERIGLGASSITLSLLDVSKSQLAIMKQMNIKQSDIIKELREGGF